MKRKLYIICGIALSIIICGFLMLISGCHLGDSVAGARVVLIFPSLQQQTNVNLSVSVPEVQEAVKLIDNVLVANGLTRANTVLTTEDQTNGIIASYGLCRISLHGNRLQVSFAEFNSWRLSLSTEKIIGQLKDKLSNRYGAENVNIED